MGVVCSPMSSMLLTGERGVKGEEERTLLKALWGLLLLAAIKASTSMRSSSMAASRLIDWPFLGGTTGARGPLYGPFMVRVEREVDAVVLRRRWSGCRR